MAFQANASGGNFRNQQINTLGDYVRQNNSSWRANQYNNQQRDPDWHQYLRRQANLPSQPGMPYGKRRKEKPQQQTQGTIMYDDGDLGISKIDFTSPPVTLTWFNLEAKAPPQDKGLKRTITKKLCPSKEVGQSKMLLKGVSGIAKPGQLVAIMGASGAGKTTLMNILTTRRPGNLKVTGEVRVNGTKMGRHINRVAGYVQQEELFIPSMTTREHLHFHAMLRINRDVSKQERLDRIEEILDFLNLKKAEKTVIGVPGRIKGLSGGEKRRLMFASEILSDPPLLFADEPTSGLDGSMAFVLCDAMRKLCNQGKTIVCTIHQPSSEIFELFDTLYLLAEGRVAYFGSRKKAETFFSGLGFEAPANYNLSDFYIQTLAIIPHDRETSLERVEHICDKYEQSPLYTQYVNEVQQYHEIDDDQSDSTGGLFNRSAKYKAGFITQTRWLLWRSSIDTFKNPFEFRLRVIITIVISVLIGLIFLRLPYNQQSFQNISAVIFLMVVNVTFTNVQKNADSYNRELPLFLKEHDDGIYRTIPYYAAKLVLELPTTAFTLFLFVTIIYWMTNLYDDVQAYFRLVGIIMLCGMVALSVGSVIGVSAPSPDAAAALVVPIIIPLFVFAGFFINSKSIHNWLIWIKYMSWLYYANEMGLINQWKDVTYLECDQTGNFTGNSTSNSTGNSTSTSGCYHNGKEVLDHFGFSESHYNRDLGALFAIFIGLRIVSIVILLLRARFQRKSG